MPDPKPIRPRLIRVRSTPEGWDLMIDSGLVSPPRVISQGIEHFPWKVQDVRLVSPVSRRSAPLLQVTMFADAIEIEHAFRYHEESSIEGD